VQTLLAIPPRVVETALGVFFVAMIPFRRWLQRRALRISLPHLVLVGGPIGFLTGIVVSTGPITVPLFVGLGLEKGAFLSTEAAASIAVYVAKVATFKAASALPADIVLTGAAVGIVLMVGAFVARSIVIRLSPRTFRQLIDGLMLSSGVSLLWAAVR
jgi:uncharacterized membrane protein YfcA